MSYEQESRSQAVSDARLQYEDVAVTIAPSSLPCQDIPHPSLCKKGTKAHREALKAFFEVSVEIPHSLRFSDWIDINSDPTNAEKPRDSIFATEQSRVAPSIASTEILITEEDFVLSSILEDYAEPTVQKDAITKLHEAYSDICKAVAEIELSASTLRTNSKALTLAKKLVTECASNIFLVLDDFRPPSRPGIPFLVEARLCRWAKTKQVGIEVRTEMDMARKRRYGISEQLRERRRVRKRKRTVNDVVGSRWSDSESEVDQGMDLWCGGWTIRMREERQWLEEDRKLHYDDWYAWNWKDMTEWWDRVEKWESRMIKRFQMIDDVLYTYAELMDELGKIDGSASANNLKFLMRETEDCESDPHFGVTCFHAMEIELELGDIDRFVRRCTDALAFAGERLRSNELKQGLDSLIKKQEHFRNTFMDFATIAIFFSSITATTLQFSYSAADESISSTIVNICWFVSIIFSIASATNSFLGAIVHQSPEYLRPSAINNYRFLQLWFKFIPPMLLSFSGLLFLVGICAFTFLSTSTSPDQGTVVKHITVIFTSTNVFALIILILLAFTRTLPSIASYIFFLVRVVAFFGFLFFVIPTLLLLDFLYRLIRYHKVNPTNEGQLSTAIVYIAMWMHAIFIGWGVGLYNFSDDITEMLQEAKRLFGGVQLEDFFRKIAGIS